MRAPLSRLAILSFAVASCALSSVTAHAATIDVWIDNANLTESNAAIDGSVDVYITTTADPQSTSYDGDVVASSTDGFSLLPATYGTSNHTTAGYASANFGHSEFGPGEIFAADTTQPITTPVTLQNDNGLFSVNYEIAPNTIGTYDLNFNLDFSDIDSATVDVPITDVAFHGGTITVSPASAPEPASFALLTLGIPLLLRRRARK